MKLSMPIVDLKEYINKQISCFTPDGKAINFKDNLVKISLEDALMRTEYCFSKIKMKGYNDENQVLFSHLHMDQYSQFLYFFSNSLWRRTGSSELCSKLVLLNRSLSASWFSFKAELPDIFLLIHPVGTIIGHKNVEFGDYLVILQNVTIESVKMYGEKLKIGKGVFLGAGSKVLRGRLSENLT